MHVLLLPEPLPPTERGTLFMCFVFLVWLLDWLYFGGSGNHLGMIEGGREGVSI